MLQGQPAAATNAAVGLGSGHPHCVSPGSGLVHTLTSEHGFCIQLILMLLAEDAFGLVLPCPALPCRTLPYNKILPYTNCK